MDAKVQCVHFGPTPPPPMRLTPGNGGGFSQLFAELRATLYRSGNTTNGLLLGVTTKSVLCWE